MNTVNKCETPFEIVSKIKLLEIICNILWIIVGAIQIYYIYTAGAGIWNIVNAIITLMSVKNIYVGNNAVIDWYDKKKNWLIVFAIINIVIGGLIGVLLVLFEFYIRNFALKNKYVFENPYTYSSNTNYQQNTYTNFTQNNESDKNYCSHCGAKIVNGSTYCNKCGTKL